MLVVLSVAVAGCVAGCDVEFDRVIDEAQQRQDADGVVIDDDAGQGDEEDGLQINGPDVPEPDVPEPDLPDPGFP